MFAKMIQDQATAFIRNMSDEELLNFIREHIFPALTHQQWAKLKAAVEEEDARHKPVDGPFVVKLEQYGGR